MNIEAIIFLAVIFGICGGLILEKLRSQIDEAEQRKVDMTVPLLSFGSKKLPAISKPDGVDKLRTVSDARFSPLQLMSDNEAIVLGEIETIVAEIGQPWRVLAQVRLSRIIASSSFDAVSAIDGQQVALLIVDPERVPIAAVEYQPLGQVRNDDAVRDAVKREALRRAGIAYIEVRATDQPGDLRADITALVQRRRAAGEPSAPADTPFTDQPPATAAPGPRPVARKPRGKPAAGAKP